MKAYWIELEDGSHVCCEGGSPFDAGRIVEHLTGKKVKDFDGYREEYGSIKGLPYPASPIVWQFEHPIVGKCPLFCRTPHECAGESCCRKAYACDD